MNSIYKISLYLLMLLFIVLLCSCGTTITGDVRKTGDIPQDFLAITGSEIGEILLEWSDVDSVEGYMVLRSDNPYGDYDTIETLVSSALFNDIVPADGTQYYYKIMAVYADGATSYDTEAVSAIGFIAPGSDTIIDTVTLLPVAVLFTATDGDAVSGVAGIRLFWTDCGDGFTYDLYCTRPNSYYNDTTFELLVEGLTDTSFLDTAALPAKQAYKLVAKHAQNPEPAVRYDFGYRLVSNLDFFLEYNKSVQYSQSKLFLMHQSGTGALGNETAGGDVAGKVTYLAEGGLFGAIAITTYDNYKDFYLTLDGRQYTDIVKVLSQVGTVRDSVFVTGIYEGKVEFYLDVDNGDASGGYYRVTQKGLPEEEIQFSVVKETVLHNEYMD